MSDSIGAVNRPPQAKSRKATSHSFHYFRNLPLTVREEIYHLILTNNIPISIKVDEPSDFDGYPYKEYQIYDNDKLVHLTTNNTLCIEISLLSVNKTVHEEAAPVLYGRNTFQFIGQYCWNDLFYFENRLTNVGRKHIRSIEIYFPTIERFTPGRNIVSEFDESSEGGLKLIKYFPDLKYLSFRVCEDIMTNDIELLQKVQDSVKDECLIVMGIRSASVYYESDNYDKRAIRISSGAIEEMLGLRWDIKGKFKLVNHSHRPVNETKWVQWLQRNRQNGLRSGMIPEPSFCTCRIWM